MPSDPADVGLQRLGKLIGARLKAGWVIEENEVQPTQRLGRRAIVHPPAYYWRQALVERSRMRNLFQRYLGGNGVGR